MMKRFISFALWSLLPVLLLTVSGYYTYDRPAAVFFAVQNGPVLLFFQMITYLGVSTWYLIGSACLVVYFSYISPNLRFSKDAMYFFCAIALSGLLTNAIKWLMGRWRPRMYLLEGLYGFQYFGIGYDQTSFPSGHATTICALATALFFIMPRVRWLWTPLAAIAVLVCLSRVVIGAHFPSDVLMGAYVGIFIAILLRKCPPFGNAVSGAKAT